MTSELNGQQSNRLLVVTESYDLDEARNILESILAADRVDIPATTQRRQLAETDRGPTRRQRAEPRCEVPERFAELRGTVRHDLAAAEHEAATAAERRAGLAFDLAQAKRELAAAERRLDPHCPAFDAAAAEVRAAKERVWTANNTAMRTKGWHRRTAERDSTTARRGYDIAVERQASIVVSARRARPISDQPSEHDDPRRRVVYPVHRDPRPLERSRRRRHRAVSTRDHA